MSFREPTVNSTGNIKVFPRFTDMTILTKHIYSLLKEVQNRELVMLMADRNVRLNNLK